MRRRDREINELFEIESILSNVMVCRIGLADGGATYIIPVCFGYTPGTIYPPSALSGKKLRCWRKIKGAVLRLTRVKPSYELSVRAHGESEIKG
jgi:nitroimidazol reductase NimA-like FMN-containing flavoprotein (pyridoxamine 5'-phosphate oxidase superfamily)